MSRSVFLAAAVLFALTGGNAGAQPYPQSPIKLVVPFAPGGGADLMARILSEPLAKRLGQPIVIENTPGGGATLGADAVAKAAPDGYTLLWTTPGPQITVGNDSRITPENPTSQFPINSRPEGNPVASDVVRLPAAPGRSPGALSCHRTVLRRRAHSRPKRRNTGTSSPAPSTDSNTSQPRNSPSSGTGSLPSESAKCCSKPRSHAWPRSLGRSTICSSSDEMS